MSTRIEELIPAINIHPGEILLEEIKANGLTQTEFARQIEMKRSQVNEIIKGKRSINAEFAVLVEARLGLPAEYWLNLQNLYDIDELKIQERMKTKVSAIQNMNKNHGISLS